MHVWVGTAAEGTLASTACPRASAHQRTAASEPPSTPPGCTPAWNRRHALAWQCSSYRRLAVYCTRSSSPAACRYESNSAHVRFCRNVWSGRHRRTRVGGWVMGVGCLQRPGGRNAWRSTHQCVVVTGSGGTGPLLPALPPPPNSRSWSMHAAPTAKKSLKHAVHGLWLLAPMPKISLKIMLAWGGKNSSIWPSSRALRRISIRCCRREGRERRVAKSIGQRTSRRVA